ncbi:hypothetical protein AURDEDRAFT_115792 [Auricularia subglabra TFB-10046 SS5]|nr:hypothetical protein AURDEDRAFT_115792 [Auricularia subglabra TFB-10046 SS5]
MSSSPSPAPVVVVIHASAVPQVVHIHLHSGPSDSPSSSGALTSASAATGAATATTTSSPRTQDTKPYTPPALAPGRPYSPPQVPRDNQPAPRMPSPRPAPAWRRVFSEPAPATHGQFDPFGSDGQSDSEKQWFTLNVHPHPHRAPSTTLSHAPTYFGPVGSEFAPNAAAWRSVQKEKGLDLLLSDPASLRSPGLFPQHHQPQEQHGGQPAGSPRTHALSPRASLAQLQPGSPRAVQMPMPMATMQMHQLHHEQQFAHYQSQARPSSRPRTMRAYVETDTETETHTASASVVTRLIHLTDTETRASSVGPEMTSRMFHLSLADTIASVPVSHPENDDTEPEPENEGRVVEELGQQAAADLRDAVRQIWEQTGHAAQVDEQAREDADEQEQDPSMPVPQTHQPVQMFFDPQTQQLVSAQGQPLHVQYPDQAQNYGHQFQLPDQQAQYPAPIQPPQAFFSAQQAQQAQAQHAQAAERFAQQRAQYHAQQQAHQQQAQYTAPPQEQAQYQAPPYHPPPQSRFFLPLQQPRQPQTCIPAQLTPTSLDEPVLPRNANPFLTPQQPQRAPVRRAQTHPHPGSGTRPSTWHEAFNDHPMRSFTLEAEPAGADAGTWGESAQSDPSSLPDLLSHPPTARHSRRNDMQSPRRSAVLSPSQGQQQVYRPPSVAVPPSPNIGASEAWNWVDPPSAYPSSMSARQVWPPVTVPS